MTSVLALRLRRSLVVAAVAALALALLLATGGRRASDGALRTAPAAATAGTYTPVTGAESMVRFTCVKMRRCSVAVPTGRLKIAPVTGV